MYTGRVSGPSSPREPRRRAAHRARVLAGRRPGGRRGDSRQRPPRPPPGGPPEPGGQLPDLVPGRLARRAGRADRAVPLSRAHDVQGDAELRAAGLLEADRGRRRPGQRLHEPRRHRLSRDRRRRAARPRAGARSRPDAAPAPGSPGDRRGAEGGAGRAADAHGGRSGRSPDRAVQHCRVRRPPVSPADDRPRPGHRAPDRPGSPRPGTTSTTGPATPSSPFPATSRRPSSWEGSGRGSAASRAAPSPRASRSWNRSSAASAASGCGRSPSWPSSSPAIRCRTTAHADAYALEVLSTVLSGGRTSRLYRRLVYEEGLALEAGGDYTRLTLDPDTFTFYVTLLPDRTVEDGRACPRRRARAAAPGADLRRGAPARPEPAGGRLPSSARIPSSTARPSLARHELLGGWRLSEAYLPGIRAVTREDVRRVAERYLVPDRRTTAILVPMPSRPPSRSARDEPVRPGPPGRRAGRGRPRRPGRGRALGSFAARRALRGVDRHRNDRGAGRGPLPEDDGAHRRHPRRGGQPRSPGRARGPARGRGAAADVARLEAGVRVAQAQLRDLLAGARKEEIGEARAQVGRAEATLADLVAGARREEIQAARQVVAQAEARQRDLEAGPRAQEVEQARSAVASAEATRVWAEREYERLKSLFDRDLWRPPTRTGLAGLRGRPDAGAHGAGAARAGARWPAERAGGVARAEVRQARERLRLVEAGPRPDQVEAARAEVRVARERLALIEAGPRPGQVDTVRAQLAQAQATLAQARPGSRTCGSKRRWTACPAEEPGGRGDRGPRLGHRDARRSRGHLASRLHPGDRARTRADRPGCPGHGRRLPGQPFEGRVTEVASGRSSRRGTCRRRRSGSTCVPAEDRDRQP